MGEKSHRGIGPDVVKRSETGAVLLIEEPPLGGAGSDGGRFNPQAFLLAALAVALVSAAAWQFTRTGDTPAPAPAEVAEPLEPREFAEPENGLAAHGSASFQRDNRYSEVNLAVQSVVVAGGVQSNGEPTQLVFGPSLEMTSAPVGNRPLDQIQVDSSGNWLAGTYRNGTDQEVLMVGRVEGDDWVMESISSGIVGYAWHPHDPGTIAFAKLNVLNPGTTEVVVEDYTRARVISRRFHGKIEGRLRIWGDWGIAFDEMGADEPTTTVMNFADEEDSNAISLLEPLVGGIPGTAMGELGSSRILIDGTEGVTILNTQTAVFEPNRWIGSGGQVYAMRGSPDGDFAVALVGGSGSGGTRGGKVLLLAADPNTAPEATTLLFGTTGPTTFDWSPDGRFVVGYEAARIDNEGNRSRPASVTAYDLDRGLFIVRELRIDGDPPDLRFDVGALAFQEVREN